MPADSTRPDEDARLKALRQDTGQDRESNADGVRLMALLRTTAQATQDLLAIRVHDQMEFAVPEALHLVVEGALCEVALLYANEFDVATGDLLSAPFQAWPSTMSATSGGLRRFKEEFAPDDARLLAGKIVTRPGDGGRIYFIPVMLGGFIWGVLRLSQNIAQPQLTGEELSLLAAFAGTLASSVVRDRIHNELKDSHRDLAELNRQLGVANQMARELAKETQAATEAKSRFLANMSHEIRTPLNGIIGMTELLLDTQMDTRQREFLGTVQTCGENLLMLINDILDLSKLESGKVEMEESEFPLRTLLEESLDMVAAQAQRKGLSVALQLDPGAPEHVMGDRARLQQILMNLLSNAVKFTEKGSVLLGADVVSVSGKEVKMNFRVTDTGIGIPEESVGRLFQPFIQLDASIVRKYGGTGLGLAISRMLADLFGTQLVVESEVGKGTTFSMAIVLRAVVAEAMSATRIRSAKMRGIKMLIVDPTELTRRVLAQQLEIWGVVVREADSLPAAKAFLAEGFRPAISYIDSDAEDLAGFAAAGPSPDFGQLVLVTSIPSRRAAQEYLDRGFRTYVTKPVRRTTLQRLIAEMVDPSRPIAHAPDAVAGSATSPQPSLVLLVEDDPINQRVGSLLLAKGGYQCDIASNGQEAVDAADRTRYDVILMDCQMPVMDGFTATGIIREREKKSGHHAIIVAMTANALQGDRERCIEAGMDDYLRKPVQSKQLMDTLREALQNMADSAPARPVVAPAPHGVADDEPLFDPEPLRSLAELVGDADDSLTRDLVRSFIGEFQPVVELMRHAVKDGKPDDARALAHTWESRSGNLGARRVQALCNRIQTDIRQGRTARLAEIVEELARAYLDTVPELYAGRPEAADL